MPTAELTLIAVIALLIALPHRLSLERVSPMPAAAVWLSALAMRALAMSGFAIFVFVHLPRTELFHVVKSWCLHEVMPLLATHLGLTGHAIADAAIVLPGLAMAASLTWVVAALARGIVAITMHLRKATLGRGPLGSVITHEPDFVVAVTLVGPARVIVSDSAVDAMDEEELEASVAHELGHVKRRHRPLHLAGSLLAALARPLPGTRAAKRGLALSLERDADEYSVRRTGDPLSLASAVCKAVTAGSSGQGVPALAHLTGGGGVTTRLEMLLEGGRSRGTAFGERCLRALACLMVVISVSLVASLPSWAAAAPPHTDASTVTACKR